MKKKFDSKMAIQTYEKLRSAHAVIKDINLPLDNDHLMDMLLSVIHDSLYAAEKYCMENYG